MCPMASLFGAIRRLLNIRQGEDEIPVVYLDRIKNVKDIVEEQIGDNFLDTFIENTEEYRVTKIKENGFEAFMTVFMNAYIPLWSTATALSLFSTANLRLATARSFIVIAVLINFTRASVALLDITAAVCFLGRFGMPSIALCNPLTSKKLRHW